MYDVCENIIHTTLQIAFFLSFLKINYIFEGIYLYVKHTLCFFNSEYFLSYFNVFELGMPFPLLI